MRGLRADVAHDDEIRPHRDAAQERERAPEQRVSGDRSGCRMLRGDRRDSPQRQRQRDEVRGCGSRRSDAQS